MKNKTRGFIIIVGIILSVIIFFTCITINYWDIVKNSFLSYTLSDLFELIVTMVIGFVVAVYFTVAMNSSSKRLEIIIENIGMLQEYYKNIITNYTKYCNKKLDKCSKDYIIRVFRMASNEYVNIKEYLEYEKIFTKNINEIYLTIQSNHFVFKERITDEPFSDDFIIKEKEINLASESYYKIKQNIQKLKMCLYK